VTTVRHVPVPTEIHPGSWVWATEIPWFPDLLGAPGGSVTASPLREAFGRQITFLRAIAAASPHGSALQLRFIGGVGDRRQVRCVLVGRAGSEGAAAELGRLVANGVPAEFPLEPLVGPDRIAAVHCLDTNGLTEHHVAEVRRAIEALDPALGPGSAEVDPVLVPWTWSAQALLSSLQLLRQQTSPCVLVVHVERVAFPAEIGLYLQREIHRYDSLRRTGEENPLVNLGLRAYREWLLELPHASLHLRVVLAGAEPLLPGMIEMIGADLTRTWEEAGPNSLLGMFGVVHPSTPTDVDRYAALLDDVRSYPVNLPRDPDLATLLHLFEPGEANMAFRFPVTPRGGVEGIATARPSTIGRGIDATVGRLVDGVYLGESPSSGSVGISLGDLNQHVLVAGLPGFGKTVTVQSLLERLAVEHDIPFLVIDPAKSDYRTLAGRVRGRGTPCTVYELHGAHAAFNPLAVPDGSTPTDHGGRVLAAFDTAFQLNRDWPAGWMVLGRALFEAYDEYADQPGWPTLNDLYRITADTIDRAGYRQDTTAELRAGLLGRLEFLANGPLGRTLAGGSDAGIDWASLLAAPAVIELRRFPGPEERALVFGLLMAGLVSYREANAHTGGLRHVTVLEEAHRVLGGRASGTIGVQLFTEAIAELRGAGEGFLVIDQAPSQLDPGVARCTGSKLAHRLVDAEERRTFGEAMVLDRVQQEDLARLGPGRLIGYVASASLPVVIDVAPSTTPGVAELDVRHQLAPGEPEALWCAGCPVRCHGRGGLVHRDALARRVALRPPGAAPSGAAALLADAVVTLQSEHADPTRPGVLAEAYCLSASVLGRRPLSAARLRHELAGLTDAALAHRAATRAGDPAVEAPER